MSEAAPQPSENDSLQPHQFQAFNTPNFEHVTVPSAEGLSPPDLTDKIAKVGASEFVAGGASGDVYRCHYDDGVKSQVVAVKALRFRIDENTGEKMFRRELGIWRRLSHQNIVPFLGTANGFGMRNTTSLVSLWMSNECLYTFLETHEDKLETIYRLQILLDIAQGLHYLHSFPIVHGDLNPRNILLDAEYNARLSDFGYASLLGSIPEGQTYLQRSTRRPGTLRWTAPEQIDLEETFRLSTKSDIYSFGCVALQVLSGKQPWSEVLNEMTVISRLIKGEKPGRPKSRTIDDLHWDFIQLCWSSPEERPVSGELVVAVKGFTEHHPASGSPSLRDFFVSLSGSQADLTVDESNLEDSRRNSITVVPPVQRRTSKSAEVVAPGPLPDLLISPSCQSDLPADESSCLSNQSPSESSAKDSSTLAVPDSCQKTSTVEKSAGCIGTAMCCGHTRDMSISSCDRADSVANKKASCLPHQSTAGASAVVLHQVTFTVSKSIQHFEADPNDFIIILMGPTGSGKTSFINAITMGGRNASTLKTVAQDATPYVIPYRNFRLVLVDMLGFGDTYGSQDAEVLRATAQFLLQKYPDGTSIKVAGIIYLHCITDKSPFNSILKNIQILRQICGPAFPRRIRLVTTMWNIVRDRAVAEAREHALQSASWRDIILEGASVKRFNNTTSSAWAIAESLLALKVGRSKLLLQNELVGQKMRLDETQVARLLFSQFQWFLGEQRRVLKELKDEVAWTQADSALAKILLNEYDKSKAQSREALEEMEKMKAALFRDLFRC